MKNQTEPMRTIVLLEEFKLDHERYSFSEMELAYNEFTDRSDQVGFF